jgi:hypothetical protein
VKKFLKENPDIFNGMYQKVREAMGLVHAAEEGGTEK